VKTGHTDLKYITGILGQQQPSWETEINIGSFDGRKFKWGATIRKTNPEEMMEKERGKVKYACVKGVSHGISIVNTSTSPKKEIKKRRGKTH